MALSRDDKIRFVQPTSRQSEKGFVELSYNSGIAGRGLLLRKLYHLPYMNKNMGEGQRDENAYNPSFL